MSEKKNTPPTKEENGKTTAAKKPTAPKTASKPATDKKETKPAAKSTAAKNTTVKPAATKTASTKSTSAKSTEKPAAKSTAAKPASKSAATKPAATKSTSAKKPAAVKKPAVKAEEIKEAASVPAEAVAEEVKVDIPVSEPVKEVEPAQEVVLEPAVSTPAEATPVAVEAVAPAVEEEKLAEVKAEETVEKPETDEKTVEKTAEELEREADLEEAKREQEARDKKAEEDKLLPPDPDALLEVRHLKKYFVLKKSVTGKALQTLRAVDDVSFTLKAGQTLGIVGESGCGKTTMGRTILKLHQPSGGQIFFKQQDIAGYKPKQMRPLRTEMQIIFQDPYSSLPPRSTVGDILSEPVKVHKIVPKDQVKDYVLKIMEQCGLRDYYFERYPHEFSGGQRQRICIARALTVNPKLVICDEPVSALDVSIQAQIINLLKKLQQTMGLTYVFISHDLSVVKHISDQIGVMYLGSMVEFGNKTDIFKNPLHPYTQALFSAVPNPNPDVKMQRIVLNGDIPSPANPPLGCKFHTRCPVAKEICKHVAPAYREYEPGHFAACHCYPQE